MKIFPFDTSSVVVVAVGAAVDIGLPKMSPMLLLLLLLVLVSELSVDDNKSANLMHSELFVVVSGSAVSVVTTFSLVDLLLLVATDDELASLFLLERLLLDRVERVLGLFGLCTDDLVSINLLADESASSLTPVRSVWTGDEPADTWRRPPPTALPVVLFCCWFADSEGATFSLDDACVFPNRRC